MTKRQAAARFVGEMTKHVLAQFVARAMSDKFKQEVAEATAKELERRGVWVPKSTVAAFTRAQTRVAAAGHRERS